MRNKIYRLLNTIYSVLLILSFFGGALPIVPFTFAIIIGGSAAEAICSFLYNVYYEWIIALASLGIFIGWIAIYVQDKKNV